MTFSTHASFLTKSRLVAGLGGLLLSAALQAQTLVERDREFLEQATQNVRADLSASRLALQKTRNPQVRAFAQHMLDERSRTHEEIQALARTKQVELPQELSILQQGTEMVMERLNDERFDRRYVNRIGIEAREDQFDLFDRASREAQDTDVKALANRMLPALRSQLEAARNLGAWLDATNRLPR